VEEITLKEVRGKLQVVKTKIQYEKDAGFLEVIEYLDEDAPKGSAEWVRKPVPHLAPSATVEERDNFIGSVMDRLKEMEGEGVEDALLEELEKTQGAPQERLVAVVAQRNMKVAVGPLTRIALGSDPKNAEKAIEALSVLGETRDGGTIMEAMINTNDAGLRHTGELVLGILIEKASSKEDIVPALERGLEPEVPDSVQQAALRLLGHTGTRTAARVVARVLESGDEDLQMAAVIALRDWPDDSQLDRLVKMAGSAETSLMRNASYEAFLRSLAFNQDRDRSVAQHAAWWQQAFKLAETKERKMVLLQYLANVPESFALDIVTKMQADGDPGVRSYAMQAKSQIERHIRQKKRK
jgi:hypothetical protein